MNLKLLTEIAALAGELLLESGAETYRVEDTVTRMLGIASPNRVEVYVTATGFIATVETDRETTTIVRRIRERNTNLNCIYEVNEISRQLCGCNLTIEEAAAQLKGIQKEAGYPKWVIDICKVLSAVSFTLLLGGGFAECIFAAVNGAWIAVSQKFCKKKQLNALMTHLLTAILIAVSSVVLSNIFHNISRLETVIAGSIMPLVPGVVITNAIRDTFQGDYLSGGARMVEAFMVAVFLAIGIGAGLVAGDFLAKGLIV